MHDYMPRNIALRIEKDSGAKYFFGELDVRRCPLPRSARIMTIPTADSSLDTEVEQTAIPIHHPFATAFVALLSSQPFVRRFRMAQKAEYNFVLPSGTLTYEEMVAATCFSELAHVWTISKDVPHLQQAFESFAEACNLDLQPSLRVALQSVFAMLHHDSVSLFGDSHAKKKFLHDIEKRAESDRKTASAAAKVARLPHQSVSTMSRVHFPLEGHVVDKNQLKVSFSRSISVSSGDRSLDSIATSVTERVACKLCNATFGLFRLRHRCRSCQGVVCAACSKHKIALISLGEKKKRVCNVCFEANTTPKE